MTIKIQCDCGTKFAFDTPESGSFAPGSIACPGCGADATDTANGVIAASAAPAPVPVPEKKSGLSLTLPASHADAETSGEAAPPVAAPQAMPKRSEQILKQAAEESRLLNRILLGIGLAVVLLVTGWGFYTFKLARPKVVYGFAVGEYEAVATRLLSESELLVGRTHAVQLIDPASGKPVWIRDLTDERTAEAATGTVGSTVDNSWDSGSVELYPVGENVSVLRGRRVTTLNRKDGTVLAQATVPPGSEVSVQGDSLLAVSEVDDLRRQLVRVSLADGTTRTQVFALPTPPKGRRTASMPPPSQPTFVQFADAGASILTLEARLLEQSKAERREAHVDNSGVPGGTLTAGLDIHSAAKEIFKGVGPDGNDSDDTSRFRVTLLRSAEGASGWTNDVSGPPCLFPLSGVDVLVAGQNLWAFDKDGAAKWQAKLSDRIAPPNYQTDRFGSGSEAGSFRIDPSITRYFVERDVGVIAPAFTEIADGIVGVDRSSVALYDATTGEVRWRYGGVGTRRLLRGDDGSFYVCGTTTDPYAKRSGFGREPEPIFSRVDGKTGAQRWSVQGDGSDAAISGKYLYVASTGTSLFAMADAAGKGGDLQEVSAFARIDPKNGHRLWILTRPGGIKRFEAKNRTLLVHLSNRVEVLRYWAF
jgi:hypothetical protein